MKKAKNLNQNQTLTQTQNRMLHHPQILTKKYKKIQIL